MSNVQWMVYLDSGIYVEGPEELDENALAKLKEKARRTFVEMLSDPQVTFDVAVDGCEPIEEAAS